MFSLTVILLHFGILVISVGAYICPPMHYGSSCTNCSCSTKGTRFCHPNTGKCLCKTGFTGPNCFETDKCNDPGGNSPCNEPYTYCVNTPGSFSCKCKRGYTRMPSGKCFPCTHGTRNTDCRSKCDCHYDRAAACLSETGICLCKQGWEGIDCSKSVDDCYPNPCSNKKCKDLHQGYSCLCGENKRYVKGQCREFNVQLMVRDENPVFGQWMDVYIFYTLSHEYLINPTLNPDFIYEITIDDLRACKMSFRESHMRLKGKEYILEELNANKDHNFFSHIHLRRSSPEFFWIKAKPKSEEFQLIEKPIQQASNYAEVKEFKRMTIGGTKPCLSENLLLCTTRVPYKLWQRHHKFELQSFNPQLSLHNYQYVWRYMKLPLDNMFWRSRLCFSSKRIDIENLIAESGEALVSDHQGEVEIIPKNTLPKGLIMICVDVYKRNSEARTAVACGIIRVISNRDIFGNIRPYHSTYCETGRDIWVTADFSSSGVHENFEYRWEVQRRERSPPSSGGTKKKEKVERFLYVERSFKLSCQSISHVTLRLYRNYYEQKTVQTIFTASNTIYHIRCLVACDFYVGTDQTLALTVEPLKKFPGFWQFDNNLVEAKKSFNDDCIILKAKSLKKSTISTVKVVDQPGSGTKAINNYKFTIPASPEGSGCSISPIAGKAVFTEFTVTCRYYKVSYDEFLRYHIYRQDSFTGKKQKLWTLIAYGGNPVMRNITFSSHKDFDEVNVTLKVKILTRLHSHAESQLTVKITAEDQRATVEKMIDEITDGNKDMNRQEHLRFISHVADVIFLNGNATEKNKIKARNELLKLLGNYKGRTAEWVMQTALVLEKVTSKEHEMRPVGVTAGLQAIKQLTDYLHKVGKDNIEIAEQVARTLIPSVDRLIFKAATRGIEIMEGLVLGNIGNLRKKNLEDCKKGVTAFKKISEALYRTMIRRNEEKVVTSEHTEIGVIKYYVTQNKDIEFGTGRIKLYHQTTSLLPQENWELDGAFHIYNKNPYVCAEENLHGDLPLIHVNMARSGSGPTATSKNEIYRFSEPADIVIDLKDAAQKNATKHAVEKKSYKTTIHIETIGKDQVVVKSSCLFISVPLSEMGMTAVLLHSDHNFKMKVILSHTNDVEEFLNTKNDIALEMPLLHVTEKKFGNRLLNRDPNALFLPKLIQKWKDEGLIYFNMEISIMVGQTVHGFTGLQLAPNQGGTQGSAKAHSETKASTTITLAPFRMDCKHFDTTLETFRSRRCYVTELTTLDHLHCRCIVAGAYTGSVQSISSLVLDLNEVIFLKEVQEYHNPLPATLVVAIWMIFVTMVRWARILDRRDTESLKVTALEDNLPQHKYLYLVGVKTGSSSTAGTTSNVYVYLKGSWGLSKVYHLYDSSRPLFQRGAHNWFLLATWDDLGFINSAVVWTDFSGAYPSWFLKNVIVENLQTNESWIFQYNSWLSIAFGSRQLITEIPAYKKLETIRLKKVHNIMKRDLKNDHLWLGLFSKYAADRFTRVQRLVTCLTILHTLVLLNLSYFHIFESDDSDEGLPYMYFLAQKIHLSFILISVTSSIIVTILGEFIGFIFQRIQDKPTSKNIEYLTDEQQDMMMRQKDVAERRKQGLKEFYPFLLKADDSSESSQDDQRTNENSNAFPFAWSKKEKEKTEEGEQLLNVVALGNPMCMEIQRREKRRMKKLKQKMEADKKRASAFMLPWWSVFPVSLAVLLLNGMLVYSNYLLGERLQMDESLEWLLSISTGIFFNVAVFIPIILFIKTAVTVFILNRQEITHKQAPISSLGDAFMLLYKERVNRTSQSKRRQSAYFSTKVAGTAKSVLERLQIEHEAREVIRDLVLYTLFMAFVLIMVYGYVNVNLEYRQKVGVENELLGLKSGEQLGEDEDEFLSTISKTSEMWDYLKNVVAERLIPGHDDWAKELKHNFYLVGHPRMRQVRSTTTGDDCFERLPGGLLPKDENHTCIQQLSGFEPEETGDFDVKWENLNNMSESSDQKIAIYKYHPAENLKASMYFGEHGIYSGGGYIQIFEREDPNIFKSVMEKLAAEWVDRFTRCIFLEFVVYNPTVEMFTQASVRFEFDIYGGVLASKSISTANISANDRFGNKSFTLIEMCAVVCLVLSMLSSINRLRQTGLTAFFLNPWNWAEIVMNILSVMCIAFYAMKQDSYIKVMRQFRERGHGTILDFDAVFLWQGLFHVTMGMAGSIAILKMLKVTTFNPIWKTFARSVDIAIPDFKACLAATTFLMFAFSFLGLMIFGRHAFTYRSFRSSMLTLLFFTMGEPDFDTLIAVELLFGRFFFLTFMFTSQYFIVFIFIAILRDALDIARYMQSRHEEAVIKHIVKIVLLYLKAFYPQMETDSDSKEVEK